ncbi:nitrous oxide reductase family maturation protein NosD [Persephonella sp.]
MKNLFILIVFIFTSNILQSYGDKLFVCDSGCKFSSIKEALSYAEEGDTVIVKGGVYREGNIVITKPVTLVGMDNPVLDGEGKYEIITVKADDVTIEGFIFKNSGKSYIEDIAALKVSSSKRCVIKNNKFFGNFWAVYLARTKECLISENKIKGPAKRRKLAEKGVTETGYGNGIHLWYCRFISVENNYISNHRDGIYFEFVKDSVIIGNLSENNLRYGLHFMFSHRNVYINNVFRYNGAGVAVMYTKKVHMEGNIFEFNWGPATFGLLLKDITDSEILHNKFYKNTTGIFSDNTIRTKIYENDFIENGWALKIYSNSTDNIIKHNNFIENTFNVVTNSFHNPNRYYENYWSDYKGFDLDRDGIGDIPYRPVSLFGYFTENYPQSIILSRSFFVYLLDLIERTFPMLIPETLKDERPLMRKFEW